MEERNSVVPVMVKAFSMSSADMERTDEGKPEITKAQRKDGKANDNESRIVI